MATSLAFPDVNRVRDLAEQIRARCAHAHQIKLTGQQAGSLQVAQAEEIHKRLNETVFRLQEAVRDFSLEGLQRRMQVTAQKLSLTFDMQVSQKHVSQQETSFFLHCDAFYVEVCCQENGYVTGVKLVRGRTQQEESELLAQLLRDHKVLEFENHLQALTDLYSQVGGTAVDRANVWKALTAMERVFLSISESSPHIIMSEVIMTNPLGHVTQRRGGLPMQLTYFVHPYEVLKMPSLSVADKSSPIPGGVGVSGQILIEKSAQLCRLPIDPNLFNRQKANFFSLTDQNTVPVPVTFVFVLSSNIPVCGSTMEGLHKSVYKNQPIQAITGPHINELIAKTKAEEDKRELCRDKCRVVCLPSQRHFYNVPPELTSSGGNETLKAPTCGVKLSKVPYLHPVHIFQIIPLLRKQLVYNTLLASCLGQSTHNISADPSTPEYIFTISTTPPERISVTMDTLTSKDEDGIIFEFVIPNQQPTQPLVMVGLGPQPNTRNPRLSEILKRCLSIPVTLEAALKRPPSFLDATVVSLIQKYQLELAQFSSEVAASAKRNGGRGDVERGVSEGEVLGGSHMIAGSKRKWTE